MSYFSIDQGVGHPKLCFVKINCLHSQLTVLCEQFNDQYKTHNPVVHSTNAFENIFKDYYFQCLSMQLYVLLKGINHEWIQLNTVLKTLEW